jgi:hypothetical protein
MKNTVLVFGSGRSGTSWLSETMARPRGYRLLFEPEHEVHVPEGRVLTDRLLLPGSSYADADRFLIKLFKNHIDNDWIAQHSYRKYKMHLWPFIVKKKIVKFVRCNLSMHYMVQRFNLPSVYIRRNPYSTIFSQKRVDFPWLTDLTRFKNDPAIAKGVADMCGRDLLKKDLTYLQLLALRWAIENLLPFHMFPATAASSQLICMEYETLKGNMDQYINLLDQVGLQAPQDLAGQFRKPSSKTHPRSSIIVGENSDDSELFIAAELEEIDEILNHFGQATWNI